MEVIATFKQRDYAAVSGRVGEFHDLLGCPLEVRFQEVEVRDWIALMRVEPRRDTDQVWPKFPNSGENHILHCGTERRPAIAGRKWRIDNGVVLAALVRCSGARIERHLVG